MIKKGMTKKLYIFIAIIVMISGAVSGGYYMKLKNPQNLFLPVTGEKEININDQFDRDIVNILLVGFDKNESRSKDGDIFRSDTNIVLTIHLREKTVDMISIPRDSYVEIANVGSKDKFNSSYGYGYRYGSSEDHEQDGFAYLMDTASNLLGEVPIYYYAAVDMDVVTEIVDAIEGVEIDVPQDLYKGYGKDRSEIIIHEGQQILDGNGLLYYARYRHYPEGDIQRVKNQQEILLATFDSLKKSNMFSSLPKIYESVQKNVKTNLDINQIAALALLASDMNKENIHTYMIPGDFGTLSELSYWIVDQEKRVELIQKVYGITIEPEKQDPPQENITSLGVAISQNILEIGQTAQISAEGVTNLGSRRLFDPGDLNYTSSNHTIVTVNGAGRITAVGPGNATITIEVEGISKSIHITVKGSETIEQSKPVEESHRSSEQKEKKEEKEPEKSEKVQEKPDKNQNQPSETEPKPEDIKEQEEVEEEDTSEKETGTGEKPEEVEEEDSETKSTDSENTREKNSSPDKKVE